MRVRGTRRRTCEHVSSIETAVVQRNRASVRISGRFNVLRVMPDHLPTRCPVREAIVTGGCSAARIHIRPAALKSRRFPPRSSGSMFIGHVIGTGGTAFGRAMSRCGRMDARGWRGEGGLC